MGWYNRFCKRFFAAVIVRLTAQADSRALVDPYSAICDDHTYIHTYCRESARTGPVNLNVVPNQCCLGSSAWTN